MALDKNGHEIPDPQPIAIPAGFKRPETLAEQVQRLVRTQVSQLAQARGAETFEESEDFDVDDELDPHTPYETFFDPVLGKDLSPAEFRANEQAIRRKYLDAQREYFNTLDRAETLQRPRTKPATPPPPNANAAPTAAPAPSTPTKPA